MKTLKLSILTLLALTCLSTSYAQLIDYYINVKTWDVYGGGTDNHIEMVIYGDNGNTGRFYIQGDSETNSGIEGFTVRKKDVGNINKIMLDVNGQLADKWSVDFVTITKNASQRENRNSEDGFYEFSIRKDLDYDPVYFRPTYVKKPRISVSPKGAVKVNRNYYTKVNFGHNPHPTADQEIMQYTETWQFVETVSLSTTKETALGAELAVTYESPQTVAGTFGAEARASWNEMASKTEETSEQKMQQSEYRWNFVAPAKTAVFKKIVFEIPYGYQVVSDGKETRIMRKLTSQVVPSGLDQFLFIPNMVNGKVEPIKWSVIENEWLKHIDRKVKDDIERQFKNKWLAEGWVVYDRQGDKSNGGSGKPDGGSVKPAPKPQPTDITKRPLNQGYKQIISRWKSNQYIHNEKSQLMAGPLGLPGWHSAHWLFIPVPGTKFYHIRNRFGTAYYLHCEYGKLQIGKLGHPGWWSAQWEVIKVPGTDFIQIRNRWKPDQYIHIEYGKLQIGRLGAPGWWSAQWKIKDVK